MNWKPSDPVWPTLTDDAAFSFADRHADWGAARRKFRKEAKAGRRRFYVRTLGSIIGAALAIWLLGSCTITPKPSTPAQASDWAKQNIVAYDGNGIFVREDWIRVYHGLLKAYGSRLMINEQVSSDDMTGITQKGSFYHVDFIANKRFTDLKRIENELAGP